MKRWLVTAVVAFCALGASRGHLAPAVHAESARTLDLEVTTASGRPALLQFLVRAENAEAASRAALAALPKLAPGAEVAAPGTVSAQFAPWGWHWDGSEIPVPLAYNADSAVRGVSGDQFVRQALAAWSVVPGSRFGFRYAGLTGARPDLAAGVADGLNVAGWEALDCASGCVLAVTSKSPGTHESDVVLNSNPEAALGNGSGGTADVETILIHEAGHVAGLEHSCQPLLGVCTPEEQDAAMYYRYQGVRHQLGIDDVAGIRALYPDGAFSIAAPTDGLPARTGSAAIQVEVVEGWNLRVLPPGPLSSTMQALPCVRAVYAVTPDGLWAVWVRGAAPSLNSLSEAAAGAAYWLATSGACSAAFTAPR